jgi:hypothetical protein
MFLLTAQSGLAQEQGFNVGGLGGGVFSIGGEVTDTFPDTEFKNTGVFVGSMGNRPPPVETLALVCGRRG